MNAIELAEQTGAQIDFKSESGNYLFVSCDTEGGDHIVEVHASSTDRTKFTIEKGDYSGTYKIKDERGRYLFISTNEQSKDYLVEAHDKIDDCRNSLVFEEQDDNWKFKIHHNSADSIFLFTTAVYTRGGDNVLEAGNREYNNVFEVEFPNLR